jgi:ABC-2 type transport system permease protein
VTRVSSLRTTLRLAFRATCPWRGWQGQLSNVLLRGPLMLLLVYFISESAELDDASISSFAVGIAFYGLPTVLVGNLARTFNEERDAGTLAMIAISTSPRRVPYFARSVHYLPPAWAAVASGIVAAIVVADATPDEVNWPAAASSVLVCSLSTAAFGLLVGLVALVVEDYVAPMTVGNGLILTLSGVVIPRDGLPEPLRLSGGALPVTHALPGFRAAWSGETEELAGRLASEAAVGIFYAAIGLGAFGALLWFARRGRVAAFVR